MKSNGSQAIAAFKPTLRRWQHPINISEGATCRHCNNKDETYDHMWLRCLAFDADRKRLDLVVPIAELTLFLFGRRRFSGSSSSACGDQITTTTTDGTNDTILLSNPSDAPLSVYYAKAFKHQHDLPNTRCSRLQFGAEGNLELRTHHRIMPTRFILAQLQDHTQGRTFDSAF